MDSGLAKLDSLPIEILRLIASVGTCESALALSAVNKILRSACHDPSIYKVIIDNRNGNVGPEWRHSLPLTMQSPVSAWARYALADFKAAQDHTLSLEPEIFGFWAPQLVAHHHPFLNLVSVLALNEAFKPMPSRATGSTYALAFCLALRLMSEETADYLGPLWPKRNASTQWGETRRKLARYLRQPPCLPGIDCGYTSTYFIQKRVQALLAVGLFSVKLRETIELGRISPQPNGLSQIPTMAVPTSSSIPFRLMMDVPLPFAPSATMELASCHLAKMTASDFLEDGEWAGFYSYSYGSDECVSFDPPMHGIRFVATATSNSPSILDLHGTGEDGIAAFDLKGKIVPGTGQILLRKVYSGGSPAWEWACMMTPVGIVGSWGGRNNYGGLLWLWKVGWTASH